MNATSPTAPQRHVQFRLPFPRSITGVWIFAVGIILLVMLGVQILSGIVLAMFYVPTADSAFDSIVHIMRAVRHGELVRNLHAIGASLFFFACYLHIFRAMYYNVYRKPYLKMWAISVTLYVLLMITAFLGYSLIWGKKAIGPPRSSPASPAQYRSLAIRCTPFWSAGMRPARRC